MNELFEVQRPPRMNRRIAACLLGPIAVATLAYTQYSRNKAMGTPAPANTTSCIFSDKTKPFTFGESNFSGGGIDDAVHAVLGSGNGEGDTCFAATRQLIIDAADSRQPRYGQEVQIPISVQAITQASR